ncbi:MAG: hypothetical protein ACM3PU_04170 [Gemmatimonadota bacterium]
MTAVLAAALSAAVLAQPAPWYKWRSKVDGKEACAQTSPGAGWERAAGPFKDARCEAPGRPGR